MEDGVANGGADIARRYLIGRAGAAQVLSVLRSPKAVPGLHREGDAEDASPLDQTTVTDAPVTADRC